MHIISKASGQYATAYPFMKAGKKITTLAFSCPLARKKGKLNASKSQPFVNVVHTSEVGHGLRTTKLNTAPRVQDKLANVVAPKIQCKHTCIHTSKYTHRYMYPPTQRHEREETTTIILLTKNG